jgi:cysteine sulfinate desulfinase/cysteine desulfurase-like protein
MVGSVQSSHVLEAMGLSPSLAQSTLRFSLGSMIREEDLSEIIRRVRSVIEQQQKS